MGLNTRGTEDYRADETPCMMTVGICHPTSIKTQRYTAKEKADVSSVGAAET